MPDIATPTQIDTSPIPKITGSTVRILRFLYQTQIDIKDAAPSDKMILYDAWAASARQQMPTLDALMEIRETIDKGISVFTPENFKAFGASYKQRNTELSSDISKLDETLNALVTRYKEIQAQQVSIRASFRDNHQGPTKEQMDQLAKVTMPFIKDTQDFATRYATTRFELNALSDSVFKYVPSEGGREKTQTPSLGSS